MVFKTLHLARQSLAKTFTHGYAQSVVAASQSSYASQNNPFGHFGSSVAARFGKTGSHNYHSLSSDRHGSSLKSHDHHDSGLAAYYAAWQKYQRRDDKEWQQFQFAKRIEWKNSSANESNSKPQDGVAIEDPHALAPARDGLERSYSTSAIHDFQKAVSGDEVAEAEAIARVDEAISQEAAKLKDQNTQTAETNDPETLEKVSEDLSAADSTGSPATAPLSEDTKATSVSDAEEFTEQLHQLAEEHNYAEIPNLFQSMLASSVQPTASAYNALLAAAINLPRAKHQVVPKALDVYSDMLRRRVRPDTTTYSILIELLAARASDVVAMKNVLEEKRLRYGGMEEEGKFLFRSNETDFDILIEDDSLNLAIKMFDMATTHHGCSFSEATYRMLVGAAAEADRVEDMVRIYAQMESNKMVPSADLFPSMITAFARSGDLRSCVECYDEYKALAVANEKGEIKMLRKDAAVYAALIQAYSLCGRSEGSSAFFQKVEDSLPSQQSGAFMNTIGQAAFIPQWLSNNAHSDAVEFVISNMTGDARDDSLARIVTHSADRNIVDVAARAFSHLSGYSDRSVPAMALCAMHIRAGHLEAAESVWKVLEQGPFKPQLIEPTAMHAIALIGSGHAAHGLFAARQMFTRIRDQADSTRFRTEAIEQIDEAIEVIGHFMIKRGIVLPATASMDLMWAMIENGGLVPPVAVHLIAGMGPESISQLGWEDISLLVQVQAGMVLNVSNPDTANSARFAHLLEVVFASGRTVDTRTTELVEKVLMKIDRPDLSQRWQMFRYPLPEHAFTSSYQAFAAPPPPGPAAPAFDDSYDPYAGTTDNKGSVAITDLLDKTHGKSANHLNEALIKFKNMRRAGRHPRFFTYARLIAAAAKEDRLGLAQDILGMARQDVPFQPQYRIVRYGWVTILDSMVAACLTSGNRGMASQYHRELNDMGAAPTANTFGLYITTLKESTKTFDEATEAVKIFNRAKAEGVEPSSFLYNALIGKLGKARRIDDCLFYFTEMRNLGIRPTSVTYGTIVNALCRVSDEKFAEELFEEMESMPNYKPRPAPYHSMMQFFLATKRDRSRVLSYYNRMVEQRIRPTTHTFKLLIDTHATLEPVDMAAAEGVLGQIEEAGSHPEAVHYAALIHARGCVQHDIKSAKALFDEVIAGGRVRPQPCLYQAIFESMVANHAIDSTEPVLADMQTRGVELTPYIANSLIHGWALAKSIDKARKMYERVPVQKREPSTYEAMTRAYLAVEDRESAMAIVNEGLGRGYPTAVANKILDLVGGSRTVPMSMPAEAHA